jgi:hypothetical protein
LSCDEELDDILDGFVGAVTGGFETAVGPVLLIGAMEGDGATGAQQPAARYSITLESTRPMTPDGQKAMVGW